MPQDSAVKKPSRRATSTLYFTTLFSSSTAPSANFSESAVVVFQLGHHFIHEDFSRTVAG